MGSLTDTPASHSRLVQAKPGSYPALGIIEVVTKTSQDKHSLERKLITFLTLIFEFWYSCQLNC